MDDSKDAGLTPWLSSPPVPKLLSLLRFHLILDPSETRAYPYNS